MSGKILVVDDELKMVKLVRTYLEAAGFKVVVAYDGQEALNVFRHEQPDLIVLDLMLPKIDGLDVARTIRRTSEVPIIMLTARADETDRLIGLELGADDYVIKPFSPRELAARVRAVLRRATKPSRGEISPVRPRTLRVGDLTLDLGRREAYVSGRRIDLTTAQLDLLAVLAQHPGQVFTRMQLLDAVQGEAFEGYQRTVDAHIKNLRRALGDEARAPRYILTVRGVGYKLAEPESGDAD
ncbi:MAG: response regulator transcription factor [Anaerolineales bacterium]|nr:MAG: response regulator transcription factor [Anaerolineales bacterium]